MEQTNLVVTPDGKTWDEVTRDTSYIGDMVLRGHPELQNTAFSTIIIEEWRGRSAHGGMTSDRFNKNFAIAYDRYICLKSGQYRIDWFNYSNTALSEGTTMIIKINGIIKSKKIKKRNKKKSSLKTQA